MHRKLFNSKLLDFINFAALYVLPLLVMTVSICSFHSMEFCSDFKSNVKIRIYFNLKFSLKFHLIVIYCQLSATHIQLEWCN